METITQKGSALTGAAVTDEVIESSADVLKQSRFGEFKGLQQFFTPEEAANLAAFVTGSGHGIRIPVFDPTAGAGSFLKPVDPGFSFGVEIDADQIKAAEESYTSIQADIKNAFPLLYRVCPEFSAIWANPPFGLKDWNDPTIRSGKVLGSVRLTFLYSMKMLAEDGQLVFICGRDQFDREIAPLPEAKGIYYVVKCDDLYDGHGAQHPCAIAFGVHPELRKQAYNNETRRYEDTEGFETKSVPREMLDLLGPKILDARQKAIGPYQSVASHAWGGGHRYQEAFDAVRKEVERRRKRDEGKKQKREFDIELFAGKHLNVLPSAFVQMALAKKGILADIKRLHQKPLSYFANYERDWKVVQEALADGIISVDPRVIENVEDVLLEARRTVCPLYPIKATQRLGYLTDVEKIKCLRDDTERGYVAGERYPIHCRTQTINETVRRMEQVKRGKNAGEWEEREYEIQRKALQITIGDWSFYDTNEHQQDIQYLIDHFELPDPGDVGSKYPVETEKNRQLIKQIQKDTLTPNSTAYAEEHPEKPALELRHFQVEDLARLMVKKDGLVAWEQGLGKTAGGLTYAEAAFRKGAQKCALYVVPQDLIPQWQEEAKRLLGKELTLIKSHGQAKNIAKKLRMGGEGLYITYYEALAVVGTSKSEMLPEIIVEQRTEYVKEKGTGRYGPAKLAVESDDGWVGVTLVSGDPIGYNLHIGERVLKDADGNTVTAETVKWIPAAWEVRGKAEQHHYRYIQEIWKDKIKNITSKDICPECKADHKDGWNGKFCRSENDAGEECGYSHYLHRVKPMGSLLSTAFKRGVIVVDELTMIQGDYSERSRVVRGLNARFKLGMTGTPVKNYIPQAFWLLWWCLGNASKRFPYDYNGKTAFENNHAVIQTAIVGGKKATRKVLPEVTNLSQLWRLLASSIIRRRKEETGEKLVKRTFHPITVPLGTAQFEQMEKWRNDFWMFFEEKYPDAPVVKAGAHKLMAPMLGLGMKLDYAATIPEGDPDYDWTGVEGVSNFTPANLRTLEITMALVKQGRKVLVGSQWIPTAKWLAERLEEKGVSAGHLLDANGNTAPPAKRAKMVKAFQSDDIQVLCVGIQAVRLGHNLDAASAAVINGLPWDFESFDQFVARIHRLTSKNPVDVYVVIPGSKSGDQGTITRRKWDILRMKGDAASLALDGRLIEKAEDPVSEEQVVAELMEKGIPLVGDEMPEADIERTWSEVSHIDHFEYEESLLKSDEEYSDTKEPEPIVEEPEVEEEMDDGEVDLDDEADAEILCSECQQTEVDEEGEACEDCLAEIEADREPADVAPSAYDDAAEFEVEAEAEGWTTTFSGTELSDEGDAAPESDAGAVTPEPLPSQVAVTDETESAPEVSDNTEPPAAEGSADPSAVVQALKDLAELKEAGVLTDEEFATAKTDLLAQLKAPAAPSQMSLDLENVA